MRHDDSKDLAKIYTEQVQVDEGLMRHAGTIAKKGLQGLKFVGRHIFDWVNSAMDDGPGPDSNTPEMQGGGQVVAKSGVINRQRI